MHPLTGAPARGWRADVVAARSARAFELDEGGRLRVVNVEGGQVADLWAFNPDDASEHLSMEHTRLHIGRLSPCVGDVMVTNRRRPALKLVADTSGGRHDTLLAACDRERYQLLGCVGPHANCADNLHLALKAVGCSCAWTPCPLNLFENAPVTDGALEIRPPVAAAGSYVELEASMPLIVVVSACPQDMAPTNGSDMRPKDLEVLYRAVAGRP